MIALEQWEITIRKRRCPPCRSRKRRTSEHVVDDEEVLSECSAAMLLMKLSCSPASFPQRMAAARHHPATGYADLPSPAGSDGAGGSSSGMSSAFR